MSNVQVFINSKQLFDEWKKKVFSDYNPKHEKDCSQPHLPITVCKNLCAERQAFREGILTGLAKYEENQEIQNNAESSTKSAD